ncbi:MAG: DUF2158 domain-containing protein [Bacteroidia bacterium]|nr:DUF2158 domain-containing protein [Bacteroidia bacterium]
MKEEKISAGDVVYLKSGSPALTVKSVSGNKALTSWFINNEPKTEGFELVMLTKEKSN